MPVINKDTCDLHIKLSATGVYGLADGKERQGWLAGWLASNKQRHMHKNHTPFPSKRPVTSVLRNVMKMCKHASERM